MRRKRGSSVWSRPVGRRAGQRMAGIAGLAARPQFPGLAVCVKLSDLKPGWRNW